MEKDFCLGIAIGLFGGAIAAANSLKVRKTVKDGQEQIMNMLAKLNEQRKENSGETQNGESEQTKRNKTQPKLEND